jgi:hypothetical protein
MLISFTSLGPVASDKAQANRLQLLTPFLAVKSRVSSFYLKYEIGALMLQVCKEEAR